MYSDMVVPQAKQIGYLKQKKQRLMPFDIAVLKQKAFQQFDLIRDAEKDIERTIKTKQHIIYGKEAPTPRAQCGYKYSNMSSKLIPEEAKKFHEDPMNTSYQEFMDSNFFENSKMPTSEGAMKVKLSFLQQKRKHDERKLCQSCIMPRNTMYSSIGSQGDQTSASQMFRTTNRSL